MTDYRRIYIPGATWFFTVNLAKRRNNHLLVEKIDLLRAAFRYVKERRPFQVNAVVVMPDHLHCVWTLPPEDADFSTRWNLLKGHFSRAISAVWRVGIAACYSRTSACIRRNSVLAYFAAWGHPFRRIRAFSSRSYGKTGLLESLAPSARLDRLKLS
ncbi:REP-associated tyrosine transposase [Methylocaldum gracile]|jgi:REP element-mobilizing transposase RayT|uniref:REP-associated tyrosine transposase n=1 Tax=Methylocaldum sp. 0917 TaxID=2485163 RepID=UPI001B3F3C3C